MEELQETTGMYNYEEELQVTTGMYNYVQGYDPHWLGNSNHNHGYETHNNGHIRVYYANM